ncbi:MAG: uroporphyrinogen-III synthase, partial [Woeseiaceae bacterium]|nr:uroporphyrinogen-III synthase [Woeseiaceae bacterium]
PRRETLPQALADHDLALREVVVYHAEPRTDPAPPADVPAWVVFFSPRGVALATEHLALPWDRLRKAAIGPSTAEALRAHGWTPDAVAVAPTPAALVDALTTA